MGSVPLSEECESVVFQNAQLQQLFVLKAIEETLMKHTDFGAASMRLLAPRLLKLPQAAQVSSDAEIPYTDSAVYAKMSLGWTRASKNSASLPTSRPLLSPGSKEVW